MKISIGADHAGFELKERIRKYLSLNGHEMVDEGTSSTESVDYPDYARKVADDVAGRKAEFGILVCGSGIGMAISANKVAGIRAANVTSEMEAQLSREHNDANVLALGARLMDDTKAIQIVDKWLTTAFAHGRHEQRVAKIAQLERAEPAGRRS